MPYEWRYTEKAVDDLKRCDHSVQARIVKKIAQYGSSENPFSQAKPLEGPWKGLFRFRVGDYRVIFRKESSGDVTILVVILRVKHRREVYE